MYFSNFPTVVHDFDLPNGKDYRLIADITRNVRFRKAILDNITLYDYYDIAEGETPEIISEKIYGTPYYHWIIMLANQRYDYIEDFPLAQFELESKIAALYSSGEDTHHFLYNGATSEGIVKIGFSAITGSAATLLAVINVGDILKNNVNGYTARVDSVDVSTLTITCRMRLGNFNTDASVSVLRSVAPDQTKPTIRNIVNISALNPGILIVSSFALTPLYSAVSNAQYEYTQNEAKRKIKIIDPQLVATILKEFNGML
jgi:hypothetical protein